MAAKVQTKRPKLPKRKKRYQVNFEESAIGALPMRTYRSLKPVPKPTATELLIRAIAGLLSVLLILRLIEAVGGLTTLPLAKSLNLLTDPLISPFRLLFGSVGVSAFFTLVFILILAPILIHRFKDQADIY